MRTKPAELIARYWAWQAAGSAAGETAAGVTVSKLIYIGMNTWARDHSPKHAQLLAEAPAELASIRDAATTERAAAEAAAEAAAAQGRAAAEAAAAEARAAELAERAAHTAAAEMKDVLHVGDNVQQALKLFEGSELEHHVRRCATCSQLRLQVRKTG